MTAFGSGGYCLLLVLSGLAVIETVLYQICTHVLIRLVAFGSGFRLFHIEKPPKGGMVTLRLTVIKCINRAGCSSTQIVDNACEQSLVVQT
jgi:hypothetical protein